MLVISHAMGSDVMVYRDISCHITPDHPETTGKQTNLAAVYYSCLFWFSFFAFFLACLSAVPPFL